MMPIHTPRVAERITSHQCRKASRTPSQRPLSRPSAPESMLLPETSRSVTSARPNRPREMGTTWKPSHR